MKEMSRLLCEICKTRPASAEVTVLENGSKFAFRLLSNDKPGCGMVRPWSPVLASLIKSGAYSIADPDKQVAAK